MMKNTQENIYEQIFDCKYDYISESQLIVTLPLQPLFLNVIGVVHGGITSALADIAMGKSLLNANQNKQFVVTVDLNVTYLKGVQGSKLIADAHVLKRGKNLNFVNCFMYNDKNELVAKATGIFSNI